MQPKLSWPAPVIAWDTCEESSEKSGKGLEKKGVFSSLLIHLSA